MSKARSPIVANQRISKHICRKNQLCQFIEIIARDREIVNTLHSPDRLQIRLVRECDARGSSRFNSSEHSNHALSNVGRLAPGSLFYPSPTVHLSPISSQDDKRYRCLRSQRWATFCHHLVLQRRRCGYVVTAKYEPKTPMKSMDQL